MAERMTGQDYEPDDDEASLRGRKIWGRYEQHRGQPIRAIVKDLITDDGFEVAQISRMWADLEDFHPLGILVRDIHIGNYLHGKLVEFSRSWTMYTIRASIGLVQVL